MAKVKVIDFWAPWCIDPQTPVLTANGYIPASKIQLGDTLVTVDPDSKMQQFSPVTKLKTFHSVPSYKMVLETGRVLIGDSNHLVLTDNGFKRMEELLKDDKVLVQPTSIHSIYNPGDNKIVLENTENNFTNKYLKQLLPLKSDMPEAPILARLLGFVMTDGYLYEDVRHKTYETHFYVGTTEDANKIKEDLSHLGLHKLEISKRKNKRVIEGREFIISTFRCRSLNKALFFLLKSLGAPVARKKNQPYFIPEWIMEGNENIKREFMSGWLGGDGCKIDYYIKYNALNAHGAGFKVNAIEFHKEKDLEREGILYAEQIATLLQELGVKIREITSTDDQDGVIISIRVATDYDSLFNLATIGYAYAQTKQMKVPFIREFLAYRLFQKEQYTQLKEMAIQQISAGISNSMIAQTLQIPQNTVVSWKYAASQTTHPPLTGQARFDIWLQEHQEEGLLWEPVSYVEKVENHDVIGITVGEPHTIVTNGIISHNCGPCRIMAPVIKEIEKELGDKVEVEEINVDENQPMSEKYGVMSIPTYIVEKDGKEVGRKIGVTPKADLIALING